MRLHFPDSVRQRWTVRRDANRDDFIVLNGRSSLANGGLDHIYRMSEARAAAWITSTRLRQKIKALVSKVSSLRVEQIGDGEAVVSADLADLDLLCRAVGARRRMRLTPEQRDDLRRRARKTLQISGCNGLRIDELQKGGTL